MKLAQYFYGVVSKLRELVQNAVSVSIYINIKSCTVHEALLVQHMYSGL